MELVVGIFEEAGDLVQFIIPPLINRHTIIEKAAITSNNSLVEFLHLMPLVYESNYAEYDDA